MEQNGSIVNSSTPFYMRLSGRLFLALTFIAVTSVAALGLAAYSAERAAVEEQVTRQLISIADMKEQQVETWLEERRADARLLAVNRLNQDHLTQILSPEIPRSRKEEFTRFMNDNLMGFMRARPGYVEVAMVDTGGTILFASDPQLVGEQTPHREALAQTLATAGGEFIQDIHRDPASGKMVMAFGHTMMAMDLESGDVLPQVNGATLIIVDMEQTIYPLIQSFPGLGETGEMALVRAEGSDTLFLNDLRFAPDAALNLRVAADASNNMAAHYAVQGREGTYRTRDYRGEEVLAVARDIESIGWGFVTKQDADEAFAPIAELARRIGLVMVVVVAGAGGASVVLSRTLTRPLAALVGATRQVAAGDLSLEVGVGRQDEIGALADAFRKMVEALKQRQQQEEVVSAILRELNATSEVGDAFPAVAAELRTICQCESLSLGLLDGGDGRVEIVAQDGPQPPIARGVKWLLTDSAVAEKVRDGRVHVTPDLAEEREFPIELLLREAGFRSRVSLPLTVEERVIGLLNLGWLEPDGYDESVVRLLDQVAGAIALAVERGRFFSETRRRAEELATLATLSSALRVAPTVDEMLPVVIEKAMLVAGGVSGHVFLLESDDETPAVTYSYPADSERDERHDRPEAALVSHVMTTGEIHISESRKQLTGAGSLPNGGALPHPPANNIYLPLRSEDRIAGVLHVVLAGREAVSDEKLRLLSAMADIAGNAVHRAWVLETLEQRVAERTQELADANERLKELDYLKSKFVSEVSHELRAPVTNLKLYLELLAKSPAEKRPRIVNVLGQQTERLTQLVTDILDLSRLELGRERIRFESLDLNRVVEQVVEAHVPRAEAANLALNFVPDPALPRLEGERNQLAQVVTNLVANAINYTPEGMIEVRTCAGDEGDVVLEVQDTGLGIAPGDLPHLFERFYRGNLSRDLDVPGTGLGLGIVQEIVDLHQGAIMVESDVGVGTTFRVSFPAGRR